MSDMERQRAIASNEAYVNKQIKEAVSRVSPYATVYTGTDIKAAYQAGVKAERERVLGLEAMQDDVQKLEEPDNIAPDGWCGTCDQILNDDGECLCKRLNALRQDLRQQIKEVEK